MHTQDGLAVAAQGKPCPVSECYLHRRFVVQRADLGIGGQRLAKFSGRRFDLRRCFIGVALSQSNFASHRSHFCDRIRPKWGRGRNGGVNPPTDDHDHHRGYAGREQQQADASLPLAPRVGRRRHALSNVLNKRLIDTVRGDRVMHAFIDALQRGQRFLPIVVTADAPLDFAGVGGIEFAVQVAGQEYVALLGTGGGGDGTTHATRFP